MKWYLAVWQKYATFNGRARRAEYWYFTLFNILISIADAVHFVPQSRPRLFVIGVRDDISLQDDLSTLGPPASDLWHSRALLTAQANLPAKARERWIWWNLPGPSMRSKTLGDLIEDCPVGVEWHSESETAKLLGMMSRVNKKKLDEAKWAGRRMIGAVYKRTRRDERGPSARVQPRRTEVRTQLACLNPLPQTG